MKLMKSLRDLSELLLAASLVAFSVWFFFARRKPPVEDERKASPPPVVRVSRIFPETGRSVLEAPGTVRAKESAIITASAGAKVVKVNFEDGQQVKRGDLLIQLDDEAERAQLLQARIDLEEQEREANRVSDLWKNKVTSQKAYAAQQSSLAMAKAKLAAIEAKLKNLSVTAPFSGVVGLRQVGLGDLVSPGNAITTLDDLSEVKIVTQASEKYLPLLSPGMKVSASSVAYRGEEFDGVLKVVDPRLDEQTRTLQIQCVFPNSGGRLRPGMLMNLSILLPERSMLMVPEKAVLNMGEILYLFVLDGQGRARRRDVRTGIRSKGKIEITENLREGETVVIEGVNKLVDGARVEVAF